VQGRELSADEWQRGPLLELNDLLRDLYVAVRRELGMAHPDDEFTEPFLHRLPAWPEPTPSMETRRAHTLEAVGGERACTEAGRGHLGKLQLLSGLDRDSASRITHARRAAVQSASNSSKRVGAGCGDVLLMRLSGLVSQRIEEDVRE
jgi:hypothetical protein